MKLSTKGKYGLRAMIDLGRYSEKEPVSIGSVAARQEISERYLEQLVALLKKAGLVKSIRGASGGYVLAKKPSEISVGDILRALEGSLAVSYTHLAAAVLSHFLTVSNLKNNAESKIGNAEAKAREIIDDAVKTAETKKKESLLEIKEESIKNKNELEKETKERRSELQRYEKRVLSKEEALDKKSEAIERREAGFTAKEEELKQLSLIHI